jgi:hypothetical protein
VILPTGMLQLHHIFFTPDARSVRLNSSATVFVELVQSGPDHLS